MGHPRGIALPNDGDSYFSFTKSSTKIAQTPTVRGNCTRAASRNGVPLGSAKVSAAMTTAVSTPTTNLLFEFMFVLPLAA
jgi:type IV secretory pathway VirB3-like protein